MRFRQFGALSIVLGLAGAPLAAAADEASPSPENPHAAKVKPLGKPADAKGLSGIEFSDPAAPLGGRAKPEKTATSSSAHAPSEPTGGPSFGVKWHAESRVNNTYWEPWVPNGEGQSVQAGVKFGF